MHVVFLVNKRNSSTKIRNKCDKSFNLAFAVIINKGHPLEKRDNVKQYLMTFLEWLNAFNYSSEQKKIISRHAFIQSDNYAVIEGKYNVTRPNLRLLGDVVLLIQAINLVELMYPGRDFKNGDETSKKILAMYFAPPYPQVLDFKFGLKNCTHLSCTSLNIF